MSANLSDLVKRKMETDHLSLRAAGNEAGVAHTTIDRVLKGESVDLLTLEKVCEWLSIPVMSALDVKDDQSELFEQIASAVALCPELNDVFSEIVDLVVAGEVDQQILSEVASFASYRLNLHKEKALTINEHDSYDDESAIEGILHKS